MAGQIAAPEALSWQARYLDQYYYGRPCWIDGTSEFHGLIGKHLRRGGDVLELGPGPQNSTSDFLAGLSASLDGLDVDDDARNNQALRRALVYQGGRWPIADACYDAVVANYVLEHVDNPAQAMAEVARVLRPGGVFIFRTPNLLYYVSLVAWLTPHWFHRLVANRLRQLPEGHHDPYPTYYRMNRCRTIAALAQQAQLEPVELYTIEKEPWYGMASRSLFLLFMAYERIVNSSAVFSTIRANILGVLRKPTACAHRPGEDAS